MIWGDPFGRKRIAALEQQIRWLRLNIEMIAAQPKGKHVRPLVEKLAAQLMREQDAEEKAKCQNSNN